MVLAVALVSAAYFSFRPQVNAPYAPVVAAPATTKRANEPSMTAEDTPVQAPVIVARSNPSGSSLRELRQCVYASRDLINAKHLADCSFYEGKPQYEEAYAQCLNGWMDAPNRIAAAEAALSGCNEADIGQRYFEATKSAARKGDADAQLCYLQGDFFSPDGTQIFTDAEIEEYKKVAPGYVAAALERGDWRIVHLLNKRSFHPGSGPVALLDKIGQRDTRYKMTRLLRLGASGPYAKGLDADLRGFAHPDLNPAAALPAETIKEGDTWAEQTYTDYFSGVPSLTQAPVVCDPNLK